ncbi:PBS lyase HEAT domain protein repeat-containing protein [Gloeothece citriformis PCC 7424]|uniref:PBS lyase HEAT domain protein repeat-containing protein n=1 Tax=Gloeothece citriformis (strain PCC 7424) TaxID=65393 RepID=B7KEU5_GLOC7|nr:HEAT repeat domain-containing protein [Gloeothece citriformis]ACK69120.1 PBS lyase HEAT domain protein repeat-containing protein [Gloeothece citriformis PCC 7424]
MISNEEVRVLIQGVETADSSDKLLSAVKALAAVRHEAAIPTLIDVLRYNNPGAAVAAVDGLIDIGEPTVTPILEQLDGYNYGARAWATRALAGIGDPRALDLLLEAARGDFALSVRRAAARGLGNIIWSKMPINEVKSQQLQTLETLLQVAQDPEWVVRYAAVVGLQNLGMSATSFNPDLLHHIIEQLRDKIMDDPDIAVRARVNMALQILNAQP